MQLLNKLAREVAAAAGGLTADPGHVVTPEAALGMPGGPR